MSDGHVEGTIIAIQCPSCKTKFGVDAGVLGQVSRPRFHCSKCDTTFSKSLASIMSALSRVSSESGGAAIHRLEPQDTVLGTSYHRSAEQSPLMAPTRAPSAASSVRDEVRPGVGGDVSGGRSSAAAGAATQEPGVLRSSPTEAGTTARDRSESPVEGVRMSAPRDREDSGTVISPLATAIKRAAVEETIFSRVQVSTQAAVSSQAGPGHDSPSAASRESRPGGWTRRWGNPQSSLHRLAFALAPLIGIQLLFTCLTFVVVNNPRSLEVLDSGVVSSAIRVPPAEIEIKNVTFRQQSLDDGASVYIVSGQVANRTGKPYSQIQVQGLTFDELGRPLQKAVGAAGSSLTTARLSSFSAESIFDKQLGSLGKNVRVEPRGEADFTIVFVPRDRRPSFFSARVFAVASAR